MGCFGGSHTKSKQKRRRDKSRPETKCTRHKSLTRSPLNQEDVGRVIVSLNKREGCSLGLTVSGGIDKGECPVISQIRQCSIADRSDALLINDQLVAVNGVRTASLKHEEIISLVKNAGPKLLLEIQYALPTKVQTQNQNRRRVEVILPKEQDGYGFVVRGGKSTDPEKSRPLTVMHVRPGGVAEKDGRIKVCDRIVSINGIQLSNSTCEEAYSILRNSEGEIAVCLEYDIASVGHMPPTVRPLSISIEKFPNEDLGISLTAVNSSDGKRLICIQAVREAGIAERCGAFKPGDQLVAVDDVRLEGLSLSEASKLIRENKSRQIKLEIIPADHHRSAPTDSNQSQSPDLTTLSSLSRMRGKACSTTTEDDPYVFRRQQSLAKSTLSIQSTPYLPVSSIFHVEVTAVQLQADEKGGFGFSIKGIEDPTIALLDFPVIEFVEPYGPAYRSGVINEGDRILEINDISVIDRNMESINAQLLACEQTCRLKIQFEVAAAVVPRSGVFCVKLPKTGGGIGITLKSEQHTTGEPHLISSVKPGSPAHRSGSIQPGDRLLAIDNFSTNQTTIEEAAMILQNAGDIVTLKIQKNISSDDAVNTAEEAIFEVEIIRPEPKTPLGITISGTDEPFEPITVDSLTTGGLAEMSRKLRPDDQVLSINNTPLYGRTVNEVLEMLKSAGTKVHLKVARHTSYVNSQVLKTTVESENDSEESSGRGTGNYLSTFKPQGTNQTRKTMSLPGNVLNRKIPSKDSAVDMGEPPATESDSDSHTSPRVQVHVTHNALYDGRLGGASAMGQQDSIEEEAEEYTLEQLQHISCPGCREAIINELRQRDSTSGAAALRQSRSEARLSQHTRSRSEAGINANQGRDRLDEAEGVSGAPEEHAFALSLHRSSERENFGIGVSDGLSEKGVFISAIQRDSPAERCTLLQLYDRILRVNGVDTSEMCCKQVVGLIGRSTNRLDLVLLRRQAHNFSDDDCVPYRTQ